LVLTTASIAHAQELEGSIAAAGIEKTAGPSVARARMFVLRKLNTPRCQQLFADFEDLQGQRLDHVLAGRKATPACYFSRLSFFDGSRVSPCGRPNIFAFTKVDGLEIFVCKAFQELAQRDASAAANVLIHEELHSLGAGEAPTPGLPTAREIS